MPGMRQDDGSSVMGFRKWAFVLGLMMPAMILLVPVTVCAQENAKLQIPRKHHDWGRFSKGAWRSVRIVSETFDKQGKVESKTTTEIKTTLVKVDDQGITLNIEKKVSVGPNQFDANQTDWEGFFGQHKKQTVQIKDLGKQDIQIEGKKVPCIVRQIKLTDDKSQVLVKVYYSSTTAPFVLREEIVSNSLANKTKTSKTTIEVIALEMPYRVLSDMKTTTHMKRIHENSKSTKTSLFVKSLDVPGGVVYQTSKQTDSKGRLIQRSTMELVDYGLEPEKKAEDGNPETVPVKRTSIRRTRKGKDRRTPKPR